MKKRGRPKKVANSDENIEKIIGMMEDLAKQEDISLDILAKALLYKLMSRENHMDTNNKRHKNNSKVSNKAKDEIVKNSEE